MIKIAGLTVVVAIAAYGIHASGQLLRADARPAITPIGTSSSNGISVAWFFDSSERVVIACRIGQAAGDALDCKAKTALP
jgi:hypothetical protein